MDDSRVQLCMAAAHIGRSMERIRIAAAALDSDPDLRLAVLDLLRIDVISVLTRAHEAIQNVRKEVPHVEA